MVTDVLPLRAIVLQCLLLLVAIAIEAMVLARLLKTSDNQTITPRQSVQFAASINLLSTVLGWFTVFALLKMEANFPTGIARNLEEPLLNFIFFNRFTRQSISILIVLGFITFFASFVVKQVGLWGLRWLLQFEFPQVVKEPEPEQKTGWNYTRWSAPFLEESESEQERTSIVGIRDLRKEPRGNNRFNVSAVLFANAWSYSAILMILLIVNLYLRY
jgi:hypothetical protein